MASNDSSRPFENSNLKQARGTIKLWISQYGWTQSKLARACMVKPAVFNHYIFGRRKMPGRVAVAIEELTGIEVTDWY